MEKTLKDKYDPMFNAIAASAGVERYSKEYNSIIWGFIEDTAKEHPEVVQIAIQKALEDIKENGIDW